MRDARSRLYRGLAIASVVGFLPGCGDPVVVRQAIDASCAYQSISKTAVINWIESLPRRGEGYPRRIRLHLRLQGADGLLEGSLMQLDLPAQCAEDEGLYQGYELEILHSKTARGACDPAEYYSFPSFQSDPCKKNWRL